MAAPGLGRLDFFFILKITSALAAKRVIPIEFLATKTTDSMGWVFLDVLGTAFRTAWAPADEKKDGDCDRTQDEGADDNPNHRIHILTET
jgi:hypothetical protein